jgi:hypothetical protein
MDTGARLGEIVGLRRDDLSLAGPVPYVSIREHPALGRTLKTPNSRRKVPLVGMALWAAERALTVSQAGLNGPTSSAHGCSRDMLPMEISGPQQPAPALTNGSRGSPAPARQPIVSATQ